MTKLPFSVYDFFGYVFSGFIIVASVDFATGASILLRPDMPVHYGLLLTGLAYLVGHVVAIPSSIILEKFLIGRVFGRPSAHMLEEKKKGLLPFLFPVFYTPFPSKTREAILNKAKSQGHDTPGEDLFYLAFSKVKDLEKPAIRINNFLNLYGFSRNVSFAFFISFWIFAIVGYPCKTFCFPAVGALAMSCGMFLRYLKFYYLYSKEIYLTYLNLEGT